MDLPVKVSILKPSATFAFGRRLLYPSGFFKAIGALKHMANPQDKWETNTPGKWYVDKQCILCSLCSELAPKNFKEAETGDHDFVYKQPENEEEETQCQEAMSQCPVEAIGNDAE